MLEGAIQASREEETSVFSFPVLDPACFTIDLRGQLCTHSLGQEQKDVTAVVLNLPNAAIIYYSFLCCGEHVTLKLFSWPFYNCNFATVINHNKIAKSQNISYATLVKGSFDFQKGCNP